MKREQVKKKFADMLEFPLDVALDLPRLTVIGNRQVYVENHRGLTLYQDDIIRISVLNGSVAIRGCGLHLRTVFSDDIYIEGQIAEIRLEGSMGNEK